MEEGGIMTEYKVNEQTRKQDIKPQKLFNFGIISKNETNMLEMK